jgi:hypothetical protein
MTPAPANSSLGLARLEGEEPALWNPFPSGQTKQGARRWSVTLVISSVGLELVHKNEHRSCRTNSALKNAEIHSISAPRVCHVHSFTRGTQASSFSEKEKQLWRKFKSLPTLPA